MLAPLLNWLKSSLYSGSEEKEHVNVNFTVNKEKGEITSKGNSVEEINDGVSNFGGCPACPLALGTWNWGTKGGKDGEVTKRGQGDDI